MNMSENHELRHEIEIQTEPFLREKEADQGMSQTDVAHVSENGKFLELEEEIPNPRGRLSILYRVRADHVFRLRIVHTVLIGWACFAAGWRLAMIGPTFPDLMQIIKVDVSTGSWLFTAFYIGNIIGSLTAGMLYDRFSKMCVIICVIVLLAVSTAFVPWCTSFTSMLLVHVVGGFSYGAVDVVTITDVLFVWKSQSVFVLQLVQFIYCIGAIISPLASSPFLSQRIEQRQHALDTNTSANGVLNDFIPMFVNETSGILHYDNLLEQHVNESNFETTSQNKFGKSRIHIIYLVSAIISLVNVAGFILFTALNRHVHKLIVDTSSVRSDSKAKIVNNLSTLAKFFFVCALAVILMLFLTIERNFTSYLTSFVTIKHGWRKTSGSAATSVYWISGAASRLVAVPFLAYFTLTNVVIVYMLIAFAAVTILLLTIFTYADFLIWLAVIVLGFGLGPLFSGLFTWLSENIVSASGKITSALYVTGVGACSLFPPLIGYLLENYAHDWLVYVLLILTPSMLIVFVFVALLHRTLIK